MLVFGKFCVCTKWMITYSDMELRESGAVDQDWRVSGLNPNRHLVRIKDPTRCLLVEKQVTERVT